MHLEGLFHVVRGIERGLMQPYDLALAAYTMPALWMPFLILWFTSTHLAQQSLSTRGPLQNDRYLISSGLPPRFALDLLYWYKTADACWCSGKKKTT